MKIKEILNTASLVMLLGNGTLAGAILGQISTRISLQNEILRKQNEVKKLEIAVRQRQLQNEKLRGDIDNLRLEAFLKAYSKAEYLVEAKVHAWSARLPRAWTLK